VTRMLTPTTRVSAPNRAALTSAIRFVIGRSGVVLIAPQGAFLGAFIVVYGAALWTTSGRLGRDTSIVILAILAGLASIVIGLAAGWRRWGTAAISAVRSRDPSSTTRTSPSGKRALRSWMTPGRLSSSLKAGMMIRVLGMGICGWRCNALIAHDNQRGPNSQQNKRQELSAAQATLTGMC